MLKRQPFAAAALDLFVLVEAGELTGLLCATTLTTLHYIVAKGGNTKLAVQSIQNLLQLFEIAPANRPVLEAAVILPFSDFEDAVLYEAGRHSNVNGIVTRDPADFKQPQIAVYSPNELIAILRTQKE
ncbi:MAG: PIN domain-containing protein [Caldilineaceae bacterium]